MFLYSFMTPQGNGNKELKGMDLLDAINVMIKHAQTENVSNQILVSGHGKIMCILKDPEFYGK